MTRFGQQDNKFYFGTLFVNPERMIITEQEEDFHEFG